MPANDSVFWIILRQTILAAMLGGFAMFAFKNQMSIADIVMIGTTMASVFGIDLVKHTMAPASDKTDTK